MVSIREARIEIDMKLKDVDYPGRGVAPDSYGCMFVFAMYLLSPIRNRPLAESHPGECL